MGVVVVCCCCDYQYCPACTHPQGKLDAFSVEVEASGDSVVEVGGLLQL